MAAPIVKWTEANGNTEVTKWQIGKINAGQPSPETTLLIWNNYGGESEVADMQDTQITTTDDIGDQSDVVLNKWIYARCESAGETEYSKIGGEATHLIQAGNCLPGIIKGKANTGELAAVENFAEVTLYACPPPNVPAGLRQFKTRVVYYYT